MTSTLPVAGFDKDFAVTQTSYTSYCTQNARSNRENLKVSWA